MATSQNGRRDDMMETINLTVSNEKSNTVKWGDFDNFTFYFTNVFFLLTI